MKHLIAYDIGTTGVKTCIFELGESIKLVSAASTAACGGSAIHNRDESTKNCSIKYFVFVIFSSFHKIHQLVQNGMYKLHLQKLY